MTNAGVGRTKAISPETQASWRWLRIGFWVCIVIAVAVVLRRTVALAYPPQSAPPQLAELDAAFASHATLTLAHILPALAFVLLTPFLYIRRFSGAAWPKRFLFPLGLVVGITAYPMSKYSVGGWVERSAVLFFNSLFLFSLFRAWHLRREPMPTLRWITRAISVLLGIATTRPVMGIFFATSRVTHLSPAQFFGVAFWIGFSINTLIIEVWPRSRDGKSQIERIAMANQVPKMGQTAVFDAEPRLKRINENVLLWMGITVFGNLLQGLAFRPTAHSSIPDIHTPHGLTCVLNGRL